MVAGLLSSLCATLRCTFNGFSHSGQTVWLCSLVIPTGSRCTSINIYMYADSHLAMYSARTHAFHILTSSVSLQVLIKHLGLKPSSKIKHCSVHSLTIEQEPHGGRFSCSDWDSASWEPDDDDVLCGVGKDEIRANNIRVADDEKRLRHTIRHAATVYGDLRGQPTPIVKRRFTLTPAECEAVEVNASTRYTTI